MRLSKIHFDKKWPAWLVPVIVAVLAGLSAWVLVFFVTLYDTVKELSVPNELKGILAPSLLIVGRNEYESIPASDAGADEREAVAVRTRHVAAVAVAYDRYIVLESTYREGKDCPLVARAYDDAYLDLAMRSDIARDAMSLAYQYRKTPPHSRTRAVLREKLAQLGRNMLSSSVARFDMGILLHNSGFPNDIPGFQELAFMHDSLLVAEMLSADEKYPMFGRVEATFTQEGRNQAKIIFNDWLMARIVSWAPTSLEDEYLTYLSLLEFGDDIASLPAVKLLKQKADSFQVNALGMPEVSSSRWLLSRIRYQTTKDMRAYRMSANMLQSALPDPIQLDLQGLTAHWRSGELITGSDMHTAYTSRMDTLLKELIGQIRSADDFGVALEPFSAYLSSATHLHPLIKAKADSFLLPCPE